MKPYERMADRTSFLPPSMRQVCLPFARASSSRLQSARDSGVQLSSAGPVWTAATIHTGSPRQKRFGSLAGPRAAPAGGAVQGRGIDFTELSAVASNGGVVSGVV